LGFKALLLWNAVSSEPTRKGEKVQVVSVKGLQLTVKKLSGGPDAGA